MISTVVRRFFCSLLLFAGCAPVGPGGGSGTETTTGIIGAVVDEHGAPQAQVLVRLHPDTYNPVLDTITIPADTTDSLGRYAFMHTDSGEYTVQALHPARRTRTFAAGIHVDNDTVFTTPDTLRIPGSVKILLSSEITDSGGHIYIPGTTVFTLLNGSAGFVVLDSVPAGCIPEIAYSSEKSAAPVTIRHNVSVPSGDTAVIRNTLWKYSRVLVLNTSVTGANVAGTVTDFPALVRLNAGNFDFSQARSGGEDIRFTTSNNTPLPYEIEQWDATNKQAAIWVKIDTVYGNDDTQSITIYWGNSAVEDSSNSAAVFDTSTGFRGVWHCAEAGNPAEIDATVNHYDGTDFGATSVAGIIGNAKRFDGTDSITIAGLLGQPPSLTLSAWVRTDTTTASGQEIISLGDALFLRADEIDGYGTGGYAHRYGDTAYTKTCSGLNIAKTGWRHVAYSFDNDLHIQTLFIDGAPFHTDSSTYAIDYTGVGSATFIGTHGNGKTSYNNRGCIDEVRVDRVVRSADWLRLCFMNQREDSRLIIY